jgi:hypothetical protein
MNQKTLGLMTLILIFGGIIATMAAGVWSTETEKVPVKFSEGIAAGEYNPEDIRGSYAFIDVSTLFEIPIDVLFKAFGIPLDTDPSQFKTKDLESYYAFEDENIEVGNESVQVFVALYKNLPITLTDTYLPKTAVEILKALDTTWPAATIDYFDAYTVEISADSVAPIETGNTETTNTSVQAATTEAHEEPIIKGTTTFQQLLDAGISEEQIKSVIGSNMPPTNQIVKDYCTQNGLSFSEVKAAIEEISKP